jgi:hypothetical protein
MELFTDHYIYSVCNKKEAALNMTYFCIYNIEIYVRVFFILY